MYIETVFYKLEKMVIIISDDKSYIALMQYVRIDFPNQHLCFLALSITFRMSEVITISEI